MIRLGKDKQAIALAIFLHISAYANGQAGKNYKYQFDGNLQNSDVITGSQSLIINYSISELNIESIINENGTFYRVSIPSHIATSTPGKPELPVFSRLISAPEGVDYKVIISGIKSSRINPSGKNIIGILIPVQEGEIKTLQQSKPSFIIDKTEYATRGIIESDTVVIEPLGKVRGKNLANLYISPVRYNPYSNVIEVITSMKIEITFSNPLIPDSKSGFLKSALFNESLNKSLLNYNPSDVIPGFSNQPVKMVIMTDTAFRKQLQPFLKWKTQKGFRVKVLYKGAGFAGDSYTELKDTLTKIYNGSTETDPPPEYLLIIGDVNRIPYYGTGNITDMYYGEFDGNGDYIPDMYIGRLPVADTTELKSVVAKIIQYEKFEFADTNKFYSRALITAGNDGGYSGTMNGQLKYALNNYLNSSNKINEYHFYYPQSSNAGTEDSIKKLFKKGVSFINYTGHGDPLGWLDPTIKSVDIDSLNNKNKFPFIISNACRTSEFSLNGSFGNKMVVSKDKGAIGYIGCSNDSYWDEDFYWAVGGGSSVSNDPTYQDTGLGAYDRLFHTHGESASDWYFTMGQINYAGNLAVSASTSPRKKYYWETYNLVGDPSVIPILGSPDAFNISLPDTLPNGLKLLSLNIEPFAYMAVSHFDTLWDASFSSASGTVELNMPGLSNDSCLVVITGQNKKPLIKTIYFSDIKKESVNLSATGINDSQGNNNKKADFGESFYLNLTVSNLGLTDAKNLYVKISSASEWITINTDSAFIGTLAARSEKILTDNLGIKVSDYIPDMGVATIQIILKDLKSEKHYSVDISLHAPNPQIINCIMDDSVYGNDNHIADPGETFNLIFKVSNQGSSDVSGQFSISSSDPDITIPEPNVKSGNLKFGETTDIPVMVKLSESATTGSYIPISSTLDCSPYFLNKDFSFRVGRVRESFESSSFNIFPWININPIPWIISDQSSFDGTFSARSGAISHNGTTSLVIKTVYATDDSLKFYYKVSSEPSYDTLIFRINGVRMLKTSGEVPWTKFVAPVIPGLNIMEWIYHKDNTVSAGSDCAWLDMIDFSQASSVSYIQKDLQVARLAAPQQKDKFGQEMVSVKVLNVGRDVINGFNLAYQIDNNFAVVRQHFEDQLVPFSDTVTVSFSTKADLSKYGIYKITAWGYENNDNYIFNDTTAIILENTRLSESVSVFPNPFTDQFTVFIDSPSSDNLQISIINVSGVKLFNFEKDIIKGKNTFSISDVRMVPSLYYLNVRGKMFNSTIPLLKVIK